MLSFLVVCREGISLYDSGGKSVLPSRQKTGLEKNLAALICLKPCHVHMTEMFLTSLFGHSLFWMYISYPLLVLVLLKIPAFLVINPSTGVIEDLNLSSYPLLVLVLLKIQIFLVINPSTGVIEDLNLSSYPLLVLVLLKIQIFLVINPSTGVIEDLNLSSYPLLVLVLLKISTFLVILSLYWCY